MASRAFKPRLVEAADEEPREAGAAFLINEVQLLLAEKRTSLAGMRTGIAVLTLPLSVLSVLVATSRLYDWTHVLPLLVPLLVLVGGLALLGTYLVSRAAVRMRHYDAQIQAIRSRSQTVDELID